MKREREKQQRAGRHRPNQTRPIGTWDSMDLTDSTDSTDSGDSRGTIGDEIETEEIKTNATGKAWGPLDMRVKIVVLWQRSEAAY